MTEYVDVTRRGKVVSGKKAPTDAENAAIQIAYHGPGLTFGELAIGDKFYWPPPIPRGPEPHVKTSDSRYDLSRGYGTAEPYYRVERWD